MKHVYHCGFSTCGAIIDTPGLCAEHAAQLYRASTLPKITPHVKEHNCSFSHISGAGFITSETYGNYLVVNGDVIEIQSEKELHFHLQKFGLPLSIGWTAQRILCHRCETPIDPFEEQCLKEELCSKCRTVWSRLASLFKRH